MTLTISDVMDEARTEAKATNTTTWPDSRVLSKTNQAIGLLFARRPDAFMVDDVVLEAPEIDDSSETMDVTNGLFKRALVCATASFLLNENAGDKISKASAAAHMNEFNQLIS